MTEPSLSIVIPVRNGMPFLRDTLDSALRGLDEIGGGEVIIRENGSTDGTPEWLASVTDPRVRVVVADPPSSAAENWTAVVKEATGDWVKLLCADDALLPGGLRRQWQAARAEPDAAVIASRRRIVNDWGQTVMHAHGLAGMRGRVSGGRAIRSIVRSGTNPLGEPTSVLFRADVLRRLLPFNDAHPYVVDLEMYLRALELGDLVALRSVDGLFRVSTQSWSAEIGDRQLSDYVGWLRSIYSKDRSEPSWTDVRIGLASAALKFRARRVISAWASRQGFDSSRNKRSQSRAK